MNAFTVQDAPLNMAPTGIATFAKVPICYDIHHANGHDRHTEEYQPVMQAVYRQ